MSKGLRSKTKRAFRSIKRNTLWGNVEKARTERLATKQEQAAHAEPVPVKEVVLVQDDTAMAVDSMSQAGKDVVKSGKAAVKAKKQTRKQAKALAHGGTRRRGRK